MTEMSGYNLVQQILAHPNGSVEKLLSLAGNGECDWLELKAAVITRPQDRKPNENEADAQWHVTEAVIGMANSRGGIVLVGINDKDKSVVPLGDSDPKRIIETQGSEAYRRIMIQDGIDPANGAWRTGCKGFWRLDAGHLPHGQFSVIGLEYQGKEIAGILVQPVPDGGECIRTWKGDVECILHRTRGQVGRVETIVGSKPMAAYQNARKSTGEDLAALRDQFQRDQNLYPELESAIEAWHKRFLNSCKDLLVPFTPLDAVEQKQTDDFETPVPKEAFEPSAEECLPDYLADGVYEDEASADADDEEEEKEDDEEADIERPARKGGLFSLLAEEPRAIVLGEPGAGKTTCLRRLALDVVQAYQPGGPVALFVPLAFLGKAGDLWQLIHDRTGLNSAQVEALIEAGRCRLFLDALNECPDTLRPALTTSIEQIIRRRPDLPVVISSRTVDTTAILHLPTFTIEPLNDDQRRKFLAAYLHNPAQAEHLLQRLNEQPGGSSLAANPLLLRMIVEVARSNGDLPQGRAGLYRRWLDDWYSREAHKARVAGTPLPWNAFDTRRGLATIALTARKAGQRTADFATARTALLPCIDNPDAFLERMTQGPLMLHTDGHVQFRHETFQEYLCAEALLANPHALHDENSADVNTWGMPIAYASELQDPLPTSLRDMAWHLHIVLGASLASPDDNIPEHNDYLRTLLNYLMRDAAPKDIRILVSSMPDSLHEAGCLNVLWENEVRDICKYLCHISAARWNRWLNVELSVLHKYGYIPAVAIRLFNNSIVLLSSASHDSSILHRKLTISLIKLSKPQHWAYFLKHNILNRDDFDTVRDRLAKKATPGQAVALIDNKLMAREDLASLFAHWIEVATPHDAMKLVKAGILTRDDFAPRLSGWVEAAKPKQAKKLVEAGILTRDDFAPRLPEWIEVAHAEQATKLVEAGILTRDDFAPRLSGWKDRASPKEALSLIAAGWMTPNDFATRLPRWRKTASFKEAISLIDAGLMSMDDFTSRRQRWIEQARPAQALQLIAAGLMTKEDFHSRHIRRGEPAGPLHTSGLINLGLKAWKDFAGNRLQLIEQASPIQAAGLVKAGKMAAADFSGKRQQWIEQVSLTQAEALIMAGLLSRDDFANHLLR